MEYEHLTEVAVPLDSLSILLAHTRDVVVPSSCSLSFVLFLGSVFVLVKTLMELDASWSGRVGSERLSWLAPNVLGLNGSRLNRFALRRLGIASNWGHRKIALTEVPHDGSICNWTVSHLFEERGDRIEEGLVDARGDSLSQRWTADSTDFEVAAWHDVRSDWSVDSQLRNMIGNPRFGSEASTGGSRDAVETLRLLNVAWNVGADFYKIVGVFAKRTLDLAPVVSTAKLLIGAS